LQNFELDHKELQSFQAISIWKYCSLSLTHTHIYIFTLKLTRKYVNLSWSSLLLSLWCSGGSNIAHEFGVQKKHGIDKFPKNIKLLWSCNTRYFRKHFHIDPTHILSVSV